MSKPALKRSGDTNSTFDTRPVLLAAPLRQGFERSALSRYSDESWDLSPGVFRENANRFQATAPFHKVDDQAIADALREFLFVRLNVALPHVRPLLRPSSLYSTFTRARRFFQFVAEHKKGFSMTKVDPALLDRYAKAIRAGRHRQPLVNANILEIVLDLYYFREHLPTCGLDFMPWSGRSIYIMSGYRRVPNENRTPRIPEAIIDPLLAWSLKYIRVFARDILAARAELSALEVRRDALVAEDARWPEEERRIRRRARILALFELRKRQGRGVPVWTKAPTEISRRAAGSDAAVVNWRLLNLHAGVNARVEKRAHLKLATGAPDLVISALEILGMEVGGLDTPISPDPDTGRLWRSRFDTRTLPIEERMLQAACYIVCAYLTGMRDSEVQAMKSDCLSLVRSDDGIIQRHRIRSTSYKGRHHIGEAAEWVTIAPVAEAVDVLRSLSIRAANAHGIDSLWPALDFQHSTKRYISTEITRQLNNFVQHLNEQFGSAAEPIIPLGPNKRPWRITPRQFRRTIAWHIANRPFGVVAGMIQYKHAGIAAFEGYAGSSPSGFRAEVEGQRRLGQIDDILTYFDSRNGARLSGPAASRIANRLEAAADDLAPLPGMIADRARLRVILSDIARSLHVGALADCFFDPTTALCLEKVTAPEQTKPLLALCEPTRCPNACMTARHRPVWERAIAEANVLLQEKRLPPLQRLVLKEDIERIEGVVRGIPQSSTDVGEVRDG